MFKFKGDAPLKRKQQRARQSPDGKIILNPKAKPADVTEANRLIETLKALQA